MKKLFALLTLVCICVTMLVVPISAADSVSVTYNFHQQNVGWCGEAKNGASCGRTGQSLRGEAFTVKVSGMSGGIQYRAHCQNYGWRSWVSNGSVAGTTGKSLRLEALQIKLTGEIANHFDVLYRVHVSTIGWMDWVKNGETAGTTGRSLQIESLEIKLVAKSTGRAGYVNTSSASLNLRKSASTSSSVIAKMPKGSQVTVYGSAVNGFYKVSYNGIVGYASAQYIAFSSTPTPSNNATLEFDWPVNDVTCTWSSYKSSTMSWGEYEGNFSDGRNYHLGLDLRSSKYDKSLSPDKQTASVREVKAAADGTVVYVGGTTSGNGYRVVIEHKVGDKTVRTLYAHLSTASEQFWKDNGIKAGTTVKRGQQIGYLGNTGLSSGAHLHFAIYEGNTTNPKGRCNYEVTANKTTYDGMTFYNPKYVIENDMLP
ncbi:MAG: peptidoglycan DD-metalloendopeptidase family protein [Clostridia bacterium]|nr:peptidoglycan DD-metalloendopeptidase family protein [Clostridia bacterium]